MASPPKQLKDIPVLHVSIQTYLTEDLNESLLEISGGEIIATVEINNLKVSPFDKWLEPCLSIDCEFKTPCNECIVEIRGLLLTEDERIIGKLEEASEFPQTFGPHTIGELVASDNRRYRELEMSRSRNIYHFRFIAPLTQHALDHIERLRSKRPKHDVELKLRFVIKYLVSHISTSHLHEIPLSSLPSLKSEFERSFGVKDLPDSLIAYKYDPEFAPPRANMYVLSGDSRAVFLSVAKEEIETSYRIPSDDWIHDFLPKLRAYTVATIEIPIVEKPFNEHLAKAVEELKHGEELLREGRYDSVLNSIRNILLNHLMITIEIQGRKKRKLNEDIRKAIIANVPEEAKGEYKAVLDEIERALRGMLQNHLSKFIHTDTGKIIRMPLKADAEYLFLAVTGIIRYLSTLSSS